MGYVKIGDKVLTTHKVSVTYVPTSPPDEPFRVRFVQFPDLNHIVIQRFDKHKWETYKKGGIKATGDSTVDPNKSPYNLGRQLFRAFAKLAGEIEQIGFVYEDKSGNSSFAALLETDWTTVQLQNDELESFVSRWKAYPAEECMDVGKRLETASEF